MRSLVRLILLAVCAVAAMPGTSYRPANAQDLNRKCQSDVSTALQQPAGILVHYNMRFPDAKFAGRFSQKIDGCIALISQKLGNRWAILDTEKKILDNHGPLFTCDIGGVNNVILEKAKKYKGLNIQKHYKAFLDDGKGGLAKIIRISSTPFSAQDCQKAFTKKLQELRGVKSELALTGRTPN